MRVPELFVIRGGFRELGRWPRNVAADQRPVPEHIAQAIAKLTADLRDALVGRAAVRTGITAVFHQGDRSIHRSEYMIPDAVNRTVETTGRCRGRRNLGKFVT